MTSAPDPDPTAKRRRGNTRRRLLDAAYEIFAEIGFGHATVETVVERAGFTRGAFYSNFDSLEELFLEMWAERSAAMIDELRAALDRLVADDVMDLREIVEGIEAALPLDERWWAITAEVTAHALRHRDLRETIATREAAISSSILPIAEELLGRIGRSIPDPGAFMQAVVAVYDGTTLQVLLEPDRPEVRDRRRALFEHVIRDFSAADQDG